MQWTRKMSTRGADGEGKRTDKWRTHKGAGAGQDAGPGPAQAAPLNMPWRRAMQIKGGGGLPEPHRSTAGCFCVRGPVINACAHQCRRCVALSPLRHGCTPRPLAPLLAASLPPVSLPCALPRAVARPQIHSVRCPPPPRPRSSPFVRGPAPSALRPRASLVRPTAAVSFGAARLPVEARKQSSSCARLCAESAAGKRSLHLHRQWLQGPKVCAHPRCKESRCTYICSFFRLEEGRFGAPLWRLWGRVLSGQ